MKLRAAVAAFLGLFGSPPSPLAAADTDLERAVAAITALGGQVEPDEERGGVRVTLDGGRVTDDDLAHVRALGPDTVTELDLSRSWVTDEGLARLRGAANLRRLSLMGTKVAGPGLKHLAGLAKLETLALDHTHLTDAGLAALPRLDGLKFLSLGDTHLTDAGLAHLKGRAGLVSLALNRTLVTDAGLEVVGGLAGLHLCRPLLRRAARRRRWLRPTMSDTRTKSRLPRTIARKGRSGRPNRSVEELLLDLAYRMHATRVVKVLPSAESAAARN